MASGLPEPLKLLVAGPPAKRETRCEQACCRRGSSTLKFESTAEVLAKCMLQYYRISEIAGLWDSGSESRRIRHEALDSAGFALLGKPGQ